MIFYRNPHINQRFKLKCGPLKELPMLIYMVLEDVVHSGKVDLSPR